MEIFPVEDNTTMWGFNLMFQNNSERAKNLQFTGFSMVGLLLGIILTTIPIFAGDMIQIKGSDTLVNLVQRLAEVYMEKNPNKIIAVTGGGSGTGIAALINKKCDIANSSREIKESEMLQARNAGVNVKGVVIAIDAISIIVNSKNPVKKLTVEQIGQIYSGKIKNWQEVGGENKSITLYGRQPNSGTYDFIREVVIKADYSKNMREMNGNAQLIEAVKTDTSGIGYVGVGYIKDVGNSISVINVGIKKAGRYFSPLNLQDVITGKYPISRPLYQYINEPLKADIKDFIDFELSEEGQKIVEEQGFIKVFNK